MLPESSSPSADSHGADASGLSPRQLQILRLAAEGLTDRQIALRTGLSEGTVRTYWERIRTRLDAKSRSEAIARTLTQAYEGAMGELEALRALVGALPGFVWTARPDGAVEFCNDWFARFSGRTVAECLGAGCAILMPERELAAGAERWTRAVETGEGYSADVHFRAEDGTETPHRIHLRPLEITDGQVQRWLGTATPIVVLLGEGLAGLPLP